MQVCGLACYFCEQGWTTYLRPCSRQSLHSQQSPTETACWGSDLARWMSDTSISRSTRPDSDRWCPSVPLPSQVPVQVVKSQGKQYLRSRESPRQVSLTGVCRHAASGWEAVSMNYWRMGYVRCAPDLRSRQAHPPSPNIAKSFHIGHL